jgi:hypothetical protein
MHPAATRSIRIPDIDDPNEVMQDVLKQYARLIEERAAKVREQAVSPGEPDMRTGWLLWQESLRQFLYFEQEMLPPNPADYTAEWHKSGGGSRKESRNLWVYERETGRKRYSITTEAGAKIQPYFDVPPPTDPNLYIFTVIGEIITAGVVRVWISETTARELQSLLGSLDPQAVSETILQSSAKAAEQGPLESAATEVALSLNITEDAYGTLKGAFPGVNDEHSFQLLVQFLRRGR